MEELLKCQICTEQYDTEANALRHPAVYSCGHGVCNECCETILDNYELLECPFCKSINNNQINKQQDLQKEKSKNKLLNLINLY